MALQSNSALRQCLRPMMSTRAGRQQDLAGLINLLLSFATSYNLVRHRLPRCRTRPPASSMHAAATPSISGNVGCTLLRTSSVHAFIQPHVGACPASALHA
ncbi:hypothetical protein OH76DRAFT_24532 [Lentinus brumalis]|uniref:Uncharacterized protein n=1 Tax=Lentinus brumalis TaxID=2498619 RepID=A0A371DXH0_9APHY|nr:hypothetical protein OH76DRAFT_24532 [Polyporus brumalis]